MKYDRYAWGAVVMVAGIGAAMAMLPLNCRHVDTVNRTDHLLLSVVMASREFKMDFGVWPSALRDLTNNVKGRVFIDWGSRGPVDPWGHKITYMPFNQDAGCGLVVSWGADGKPGGLKQDRDRVMTFQ